MGKSKGSGTGAKKRPKPKHTFWRGDTLWGRVTVKGETIRWSLRTSDAAVAKERVGTGRKRAIAAAHYGDDRKTYEHVFAEWSGHIVTQVSSNTAARYAVSLNQLAPHLLGCYIDEIDKVLISGIVSARREAKTSMATIRRDLTALSSVLSFAEDHDWRDGNPALDRLRKLKERRDPIVLPSDPDITKVLSRMPGLFSAMVKAAWFTGCRQDELRLARRDHFDLGRRQLTVIGKGNKLRTLSLDDRAVALLQGLPAHLKCPYLFWHSQGLPYQNVSSRFRALVMAEAKAQKTSQSDEAVFRPFRFHDLRHRFAVDWLKEAKSIYDLQHHLGHTSVKTTEMYVKYLTPEEERRVKQQMTHNASQ